jgi:hypothetical protein
MDILLSNVRKDSSSITSEHKPSSGRKDAIVNKAMTVTTVLVVAIWTLTIVRRHHVG